MTLWGAFAALAASDACTVDDNYSVDECVAGEKRACFGPNDCPGVQFCIADGDGFGECDCGVGGSSGGSGSGEGGAAGELARGGTAGTDDPSAGQAGRDETAGTAGDDRGGAGGTDTGVGGEPTQGGAAAGGETATGQGGVEPAGGTAGDGTGEGGGMDVGGGGVDAGSGGAGGASGGAATEGGSNSGGNAGGPASGGMPGCTQGLTECGPDCVDTNDDPDHCAECENACPSSYICAGAICMKDTCGPALFCEDFEAGHDLLFTEVSGNWEVTTDGEDGPAYEATGTSLAIAEGTASLTDVRVNVYYRLLAAPNGGGGGPIARYQQDSGLYYGVIFEDSVARLLPSIGGTGCGDEDIPAFNVGESSTFAIRVEDEGGGVRIRTYFSGQALHNCLDSSNPLPAGRVGFQASGTGVHVSFGDIFVEAP